LFFLWLQSENSADERRKEKKRQEEEEMEQEVVVRWSKRVAIGPGGNHGEDWGLDREEAQTTRALGVKPSQTPLPPMVLGPLRNTVFL